MISSIAASTSSSSKATFNAINLARLVCATAFDAFVAQEELDSGIGQASPLGAVALKPGEDLLRNFAKVSNTKKMMKINTTYCSPFLFKS